MSTLRKRIERRFAAFGHLIYRHHFKTLALMLVFMAALFSQLPKLTIDTSTESFLHDDDPILLDYNAFRDQFGREDLLMLAVTSPDGVFDMPFLEKLRAFHQELEEGLPHLDDITSLVNARNTRGEEGALLVEDLLAEWPQTPDALAKVRERALDNPVYRNMLLSEDGRVTTLLLKLDSLAATGTDDALAGFDEPDAPADTESERRYLSDAENSAVVKASGEIAARFQGSDFRIHMAGAPAFDHVMKSAMQDNMRRFMGLALLAIGAVLFLMFRRLAGVLLPLAIVALSLLSTLGLMAALGVAIKLPTQILPSFLLAVGVGAVVHVLAIFFRDVKKTRDKDASIGHALGHSGLAIVMTSLTTAAGLASFAGAEVAPIADLGLFASLGVLLALLYTLVLLPALLSITPLKATTTDTTEQQGGPMDRLLIGIADFSTTHPRKILAVSALIFAVALAGVLQVRFSHMPINWLQENEPFRQATSYMDEVMQGSNTVEVIVDTGRENGIYDPAVLNGLEQLKTDVEGIRQDDLFVGKTTAISDILKEIHRALNENRPEFYAVPQDPDLIAQEFLLFENSGSDDLEDFVDSGFTKTRFSVKTPWLDAVAYPPFINTLEQKFHEVLGSEVGLTVTGMTALLGRTFTASIHSTAVSYAWAAAVITLMMVLLIGDLRIGLVSMIPNLLPIMLTLGLMGWLGMRLDMFTMLIGSIAIGLAVDDTIHFMHNYRRYHHQTGDVQEAVRQTLLSTGRAMLVTTIVLSIGFFIYMFSTLNNLFSFGLLTGFTILMALLADFLVAPALMAVMSSAALSADDEDSDEDQPLATA